MHACCNELVYSEMTGYPASARAPALTIAATIVAKSKKVWWTRASTLLNLGQKERGVMKPNTSLPSLNTSASVLPPEIPAEDFQICNCRITLRLDAAARTQHLIDAVQCASSDTEAVLTTDKCVQMVAKLQPLKTAEDAAQCVKQTALV